MTMLSFVAVITLIGVSSRLFNEAYTSCLMRIAHVLSRGLRWCGRVPLSLLLISAATVKVRQAALVRKFILETELLHEFTAMQASWIPLAYSP
jgi:hypothetical protein